MENFKPVSLPLYTGVLAELLKLLESKTIFWTDNQICINTVTSQPDNFALGTGSLAKSWHDAVKSETNGVVKAFIPKRKTDLIDENFTILCNQFKNTVFESIYSELNKNYTLGRVRIMKSEPKTCLSWHHDSSPRLHYPIKTAPGAFMVIENEVKHLPERTWWWTDTRKNHTAFNGSNGSRIHLVAVILNSNH